MSEMGTLFCLSYNFFSTSNFDLIFFMDVNKNTKINSGKFEIQTPNQKNYKIPGTRKTAKTGKNSKRPPLVVKLHKKASRMME